MEIERRTVTQESRKRSSALVLHPGTYIVVTVLGYRTLDG